MDGAESQDDQTVGLGRAGGSAGEGQARERMAPGRRRAAVLVLASAALAGGWFGGRPAAPVPVEVSQQNHHPQELAPGALTVYVSGAVVHPGLVEIPAGGRVADAIAAAGGALGSAELGALNLAAPIADGEHIQVPTIGEETPSGPGAPAGDGKVHLNQASVAELDALPGVGPVIAERIVAYREEHGPFRTVEDLLDVPGIGEGKLASLRDAVVVP